MLYKRWTILFEFEMSVFNIAFDMFLTFIYVVYHFYLWCEIYYCFFFLFFCRSMPSVQTMTQELEQGVIEILDFAKEQKKELLGLLDALYEAKDQVSFEKQIPKDCFHEFSPGCSEFCHFL